MVVSNTIRFWTYGPPLILSIICSCFGLYCLLSDRLARSALHNHLSILLLSIGLISELTNYPWMLYWYLYDGVWYRSSTFCSIWAFLDWGFYCSQIILFAWASIERHILIFHDKWLKRKYLGFILHYLPLLILFVYCSIYYTILYFIPPCQNIFNSTTTICVRECLFQYPIFLLYDTIAHQIIPVLTVVFVSLLLLFRVLCWKTRLRQANRWRRHRRMTVQLLSIAFLYLIFASPYSIYNILLISSVDSLFLENWRDVTIYLSYFPILLTPFVCLFASNEVRNHLVKVWPFYRYRRTTIAPATQLRSIRPQQGTN